MITLFALVIAFGCLEAAVLVFKPMEPEARGAERWSLNFIGLLGCLLAAVTTTHTAFVAGVIVAIGFTTQLHLSQRTRAAERRITLD